MRLEDVMKAKSPQVFVWHCQLCQQERNNKTTVHIHLFLSEDVYGGAVEVAEEVRKVEGDLTRYGLGLDDVWLTCHRLRKPSPSATPHYE